MPYSIDRPLAGALALLVSSLGNPAHAAGIPTLQEVSVTPSQQDLIGVADSASEGTVTARQLASRPLLRPAEVLEFVPEFVPVAGNGADDMSVDEVAVDEVPASKAADS